MLNAEDPWYKTNATEFNRLQICVDVFLFSSQYTDIATLETFPKLTAGSLYYYPGFSEPRDGPKFETELKRCLTRGK